MSDATIRPLDIVDVKAGIRAGRLFVQIRDNHLLLGDFQTGEAVSLSDIEVKAVMHAKWLGEKWCFHCSNCGGSSPDDGGSKTQYCPGCGAKMDGGMENAAD